METLEFLVEAGNAGQRLDRFLAERELGLTRNALQQLLCEVQSGRRRGGGAGDAGIDRLIALAVG